MRFDRFRPVVRLVAATLALFAAAALIPGCSSKKPVEVLLPPLSRIDLTPTSDSLAVGGTRLFVAAAYDTGGQAVSGAGFTWTTSDAGVASVSNNGLVTALGEGSAKIIASIGATADTATVFVHTATGGWFTQTSNTSNDLAGVFFFADGRTGWAVGTAGRMVATSDAGATWTVKSSGTSFALTGVWFTSSLAGWAVGAGGTVLKTVDGGTNWVRQTNVNALQDFQAVRFVDALHGCAVGTGGVIATTRDGGASWSKRFPTGVQLNGVAFADTLVGWVVGANGVIAGTRDGGDSWYVVQPAVTGNDLRAVERLSDTKAWAVGQLGTIASTQATADSLAWSTGTVGAGVQLNAVHMVSTLVGYAVGSNGGGAVFKTVDGGASWFPQTANSAQSLTGVFFVDALRGWAVGAQGRIVHTSVGGNL